MFFARLERPVDRIDEEESEKNLENTWIDDHGERAANECTCSRSHLEQDSDTNVRIALANVRRRGPGGCRDNGDERRADAISEVDAKEIHEHRHHNDATAQAGERPQRTGGEGADADEH